MRALPKILILAALVMTAAGCAQEKTVDPVTPPVVDTSGGCRGCTPDNGTGTGIPDAPAGTGVGTNPTETGYDSGSTAQLNTSSSTLSQMFYNSGANSPTNIRINIDINRKGEEVIISYIDNGKIVEAALGSVHPYNTAVSNTRYNGWTTNGAAPVWKGFFQDQYGAVVLIIDKYLGTGDGNAQILGGSIWFQNFPEARYPSSPYYTYQGSQKMCWDITMGPYDCRSFLVGESVVMSSTLEPTNKGPNALQNYRKLGDFTGINRTAAGL